MKAGNSVPSSTPASKIAPLFAPLRIEYSWEGSFQFDKLNDGHAWHFNNPPSWKRTELIIKRGNKSVSANKSAPTKSLVKLAKWYTGDLKSTFLTESNKLSGSTIIASQWQLIGWLAGTNTANDQVGRGLSLVLNALVRQSTTKSFDLVSSFSGEHISVEVRGLGVNIPSWFYLHATPFEDLDEYLVCFPELFLDKSHKELHADLQRTLMSLKFVRCWHHYDVQAFKQDEKKIVIALKDRAVIAEYVKASICGCLPLPGRCPRKSERKEPVGVNSPEVVVSSPVVGAALAKLTSIWQDPHAKSVLISSPPGSGKEVFANSIPVGNGRPADRVNSLSMASDDQDALERQLYGFAHPDGSIQDGLIAKSANAALFLDEIHQPEKMRVSSARASLLRTLEAGVYYPQESTINREVGNVLWIMATSKTLSQLGQFKPIDFWTRMTHALEIPHPLKVKKATCHDIVADFFRLFWWDFCDKQYDFDPVSDPSDMNLNSIPAYWQQRTMLRQIVAEDGSLLSNGAATSFASRFLSLVQAERSLQKTPHHFSVRGIRNMVSRLFALSWARVAQGLTPWGKEKDGEDFESNVITIFAEIKNVARIS